MPTPVQLLRSAKSANRIVPEPTPRSSTRLGTSTAWAFKIRSTITSVSGRGTRPRRSLIRSSVQKPFFPTIWAAGSRCSRRRTKVSNFKAASGVSGRWGSPIKVARSVSVAASNNIRASITGVSMLAASRRFRAAVQALTRVMGVSVMACK